MNRQETAALFGWIRNTYDPRMVMGDLEVVEWQRQLENTTTEDAAAAVRRHYAQSTARVMLADILVGARLIRRDALTRARSDETLRAIEAARDAHEQADSRNGYLAASQAVAAALAAKHPEAVAS